MERNGTPPCLSPPPPPPPLSVYITVYPPYSTEEEERGGGAPWGPDIFLFFFLLLPFSEVTCASCMVGWGPRRPNPSSSSFSIIFPSSDRRIFFPRMIAIPPSSLFQRFFKGFTFFAGSPQTSNHYVLFSFPEIIDPPLEPSFFCCSKKIPTRPPPLRLPSNPGGGGGGGRDPGFPATSKNRRKEETPFLWHADRTALPPSLPLLYHMRRPIFTSRSF